MYDFNSALFLYKFIFMTELLSAEATFVFLLKERKRFFMRAALSVLGIYAVTFALPIVDYSALYVSLLFGILFIVSLGALKLCFDERWGVILFCGIWSYTVQHFSYIIGNYITTVAGIANGSFYEETITAYNAGALLISVAVFVVFYFCSLLLVKRLFRNINEIRINAFVLVILSIISLSIEIVINSIVVSLKVETISTVLLTLCYVYDCIGCILTMGLLIFSIWNKSLEQDKAVMALLLKKERENFEIRKDKIEKINIMCHDLKHRIRELGETGYASEKLKKLESAIKSYDMAYHTGNEVLDIILAEIGEKCESRSIQLICIADGSVLGGMEVEHIYSLFDNALNNALEAVKQVTDAEKRYIELRVLKKGEMISIHIENYFNNERELVFKNGVPQTTKAEEEWHGFGMRSIQLVVEKYEGGMNVAVKDDLFALNVFLPCNEKQQ